jgi:chromatin segregation and condensation protein Rec8/ScpA/Scc1 (kleisin family)
MLELVKMRAIRIFQEALNGPIQIEAAVGIDQATERVATEDAEEEQNGTSGS